MPKSCNILTNLDPLRTREVKGVVQNEPKVSLFLSNFVLIFRGLDCNVNYSVWDVFSHIVLTKVAPSSEMGDWIGWTSLKSTKIGVSSF